MADATKLYPHENDPLSQKVLFLGDENIGKTTFIETVCGYMRDIRKCDIFRGSCLIFNQYCFDAKRGNRCIPIQLLDLPAGTTAESRRDQYPTEVNIIVFCFAVDNPNSFANVREIWRPEYRRYYDVHSTRCFLLGLRNDLRENPAEVGKSVTLINALDAHENLEFSGDYMECSALKNPEHVNFLTERLIREVSYSI